MTAAFGLAIVASGSMALAADLPKATEIYPKMGIGWNLGNTMEVPSDPTAWGNIVPNAAIIKGVKNAGFSTIRIPCAWDSHATNGTISSDWLSTVKAVVDLAINEGMYVILNSHWDNGWLEDNVFSGNHPDRDRNPTSTDSSKVRQLQEKYWKQIADYFKDYDEHLLFASANEPGVNDPRDGAAADGYTENGQYAFTDERMTILKRLHEACLRSVRASGGNNATRTVIVQTPRTEIDKYTQLAAQYPTDPAGEGYTMVEVHFYPYQFSFMNSGDMNGDGWTMYEFYYWEDITTGTDANHTCTSAKNNDGSKNHIDKQFKKLQTAFADKDIPVVIGEMGANKRYDYESKEGFNLEKHLDAIAAWYGYTVASAKTHGIVPIIWDTGFEGDGVTNLDPNNRKTKDHMTIIRRQSKYGTDLGAVVDEKTLSAIMTQYAAAPAYTPAVKPVISENDKALWVTITSKTAAEAENSTVRINLSGADWSNYTAISFQIRTEGTFAPCPGNQWGWGSFTLFTMSSNDWNNAWTQVPIGQVADFSGALNTVKVEFGEGDNQLSFADQKNVNALGILANGTQFNGTMYLNNILLHKANGTVDTLQSFDKALPDELGGNANGILIQANADGTGPSTINSSNSAAPASSNSSKPNSSGSNNSDAIATPAIAQNVHFAVERGSITATFSALAAGRTTVSLMNSLGQVIASKNVNATRGANSVSLETSYQGTAFLVIRQGSQKLVKAIQLK